MNSVAIIDVSQHFIDTSISQILEALVKPAPLGECINKLTLLITQEATRRTARRHEKAEMCYNPYAIIMKVWTAFLLVCAAASVVAWLVALYHENRVCPFTAVARFMRGLPWGGRLVVLPLFLALIVYGSVKDSGERGMGNGERGTGNGEWKIESHRRW